MLLPEDYWTTRDEKMLRVQLMKDRHIENILRMFKSMTGMEKVQALAQEKFRRKKIYAIERTFRKNHRFSRMYQSKGRQNRQNYFGKEIEPLIAHVVDVSWKSKNCLVIHEDAGKYNYYLKSDAIEESWSKTIFPHGLAVLEMNYKLTEI